MFCIKNALNCVFDVYKKESKTEMNNDISRDTNNYINTKINTKMKIERTFDKKATAESPVKDTYKNIDMEKTMEYVLGKMQADSSLNASKILSSVKDSTVSFLQNAEFAQNWIDLCDEMIEKGYSLEEAIDKTDAIFETIKSNLQN